MRTLEAIRKANRPGPPEHSIRLRAACFLTVTAAIAACASMGEVSDAAALGAIGLVALGMVFSYATRRNPPGWVKIAVAAGAIGVSVWFVHAVSTPATDITSVEDPLTVLLVSVLVVHSFHVPSRRDLMFSLAASAGLMAVAGSQAIDLIFGFYVVAWAGCTIWGLIEMWASASDGGRLAPIRLGIVLATVIAES